MRSPKTPASALVSAMNGLEALDKLGQEEEIERFLLSFTIHDRLHREIYRSLPQYSSPYEASDTVGDAYGGLHGVVTMRPEATTAGVPETREGALAPSAVPAIDDLSIVGVRPKPSGLSASLGRAGLPGHRGPRRAARALPGGPHQSGGREAA